MSHDDDALEEFDLSAWDVPPPPADLADGVIDRMGGTDVGIAVPVDGGREPRRAWIIASVAVAVVVLALGVWSLIRATRHAAPATGGVVAERARTLSLDTVHADLDVGADVRWKRDGDVLIVEQRAGTVAWHVDSGEKLVIDAGASLASVEASGANLRVEVQMNAMDARVIGASALTAAAVAMVTVVVYEGHVKVGHSGQQTVVVAPGSTYQVKAEDQEAPVVGSAPVGLKQKVAILGLELVGIETGEEPVVVQVLDGVMRNVAKTEGPYVLAPGSDKSLVDEKLMNNCATEAPPCMAAIGANLGADVLVYGKIEHTKDGYAIFAKLLDVAKNQVVKSGSWVMPNAEAEAEGLDLWGKRIYTSLVGSTATTCDAEALKEEGLQNINGGQHAAALSYLEDSLKCKHDPYVVQLAFMESCSSGNSPKAKLYYKQLQPAQQTKFAQICIRMKVAFLDDGTTDKDKSCAGVDEVSCVLNNYEGDCCQKYRKQLERAEIQAALAKAKPSVMACGDKAPDGGELIASIEVNAKGTVTNVTATKSPNDKLFACVKPILEKLKFSEKTNGTTFVSPFTFKVSKATCDAVALKKEGLDDINLGQHAAALSKFEESLRCKSTGEVTKLAFMEACNSQNSPKAKLYYKRMTIAEQEKFGQICIRNKVAYQGNATVTPPANCDADALKEQGLENVNMGQHAAALSRFEASLKCRRDPYLIQLAFMEACSSGNSPKAKVYYKQMSGPSQQKFAQMCKRQNVDYQDFDDDPTVGYLQLFTKPSGAKVFVDGGDSGFTTPVSGEQLQLKPGKHKITFVIGDDRFTYSVVIKAGSTETLSKDLQ